MEDRPWSPQERGRHLDVDVDLVLKNPTEAFRRLLHVVPGWDRGCAEEVEVEQTTAAMTNLVFRCHSPSARENQTVIVRVFGRGGKLFNAQHERAVFVTASALGLGPKCLVEFGSARVEEFLPGDNLSAARMRAPEVAAAIARAMAAWHVQMTPAGAAEGPAPSRQQPGAGAGAAAATAGQLTPAIWGRIRKWHAAAVEVARERVEELGLSNALQELAQLEASFAARFPPWVGFCHNDLQYGNMLLFPPAARQAQHAQRALQAQQRGATEPAGPPEGQAGPPSLAQLAQQAAQQAGQAEQAAVGSAARAPQQPYIRIIDYDYSALNDVAYDVGNHWCEYTYDYHSDQPESLDWSKWPTLEEQRAFCRAYVEALAGQLAEHAQQAQQAGQQQDGDGCGGGEKELGAEDSASAFCAPGAAAEHAYGSAAGGGSSGDGGGGEDGGGASCEAGLALAAAILGSAGTGSEGGPSASLGQGGLEPVVDLLMKKAQAYATLTHLKWSLWGLIQDKMSDVEGFDYFEYARQRVAHYHAAKAAYLADN